MSKIEKAEEFKIYFLSALRNRPSTIEIHHDIQFSTSTVIKENVKQQLWKLGHLKKKNKSAKPNGASDNQHPGKCQSA